VTILVTGAAGFIGSNYVRTLLRTTDEEVRILDALTYAGNLDTLRDIIDTPRVTFVEGDIADRDIVSEAMDGCSSVVHFAAESHVDRSLSGPDAFVLTNCLGTNVLCDTAVAVGVERFVHVSTDEVYGSRREGSFSEDDNLTPSSPYSASKAGSDLIALGYHTSFGLPVVVTRAANNYGPYQYPEKVIPLFITNLLDGAKVPVYGNGLNIRDWLHVDDHCAAIDVARHRGVSGEVYNVGGTRELTNLDLTNRILSLCGADESSIEFVEDRLGHDFRYSITLDKIEAIGWKPSVDVDDGLAATVEWYRENRWWWGPKKA